MLERLDTNWGNKFKGEEFQANDEVIGILNALICDLCVDTEYSNPRSPKTVPTWHVLFRGVRILALDVNKGGIRCRMLKMDYWPENIKSHQGFQFESWNKGKTANISLNDENTARRLRPKLEKHLAILESVLDGKCKNLKIPRIDQEHLKEQYFETEVAENITKIEPGLSLVRRQLNTPVGRLDLLCKDKEGFPVVLELKISASAASVLDQVNRYVEFSETETGIKTRGIILVRDDNVVKELTSILEKSPIQLILWQRSP